MSAILLSEYIQIIMTLEEAVQHVVMTAIQEVSSSEGSLFLWYQKLLQHLPPSSMAHLQHKMSGKRRKGIKKTGTLTGTCCCLDYGQPCCLVIKGIKLVQLAPRSPQSFVYIEHAKLETNSGTNRDEK